MSLRSLLSALLLVAAPSTALADAVVIVTVHAPDGGSRAGTVVLSRGPTRHTCATSSEGRCEIRGVAGGSYSVTVSQPDRPSPKAKQVMIPPTGEVKLIVNAS